jgi:hypothetical protein
MAVKVKSCTVVRKIEERFTKTYVQGSGFGDNAKFTDQSAGWWIACDGCVSVCVGYTKPDANVGDRAEISLTIPG